MGEGFQELGLSAPLLGSLEQLGFSRPTAIQRAAIPVLRRGSNALIHAGSGAGATAALGLALADRLAEGDLSGPGPQVLVITPTEERAAAIALELGRIGRAVGVTAAVRAPAWLSDATVVVVPINRTVSLIESSALKLDQLKAVVLHDLSAIHALGEESALDTLLSTLPRDAQRIIVTSELNPAIEKFAEAHARKALHVPHRAAVPDEAPAARTPTTTLEYAVVNDAQMIEQAAHFTARGDVATVFARSRERAQRAREELPLRGQQAAVKLYGEESSGRAVGLGAPYDVDTLSAAFGSGGVVLIQAQELPHLRNIAKQANIALKAVRGSAAESSDLERFRNQLRKALNDEDLDAQLLVLSPLLHEFTAAEVAAAATALLRKRVLAQVPVAPVTPPGAAPAFVKLFISIGQRDGIQTRELVGAITGESGVSGDQLGRVDVRDTFSIVEISAQGAEKVIKALNGTSLRGRSLRVDYDRRGAGTGGGGGGARRSMPPRRTQR